MISKYLFALPVIATLFISCTTGRSYVIVGSKGEYIPVTATVNPSAKIVSFVEGYKRQLDERMNVVVGKSAQYMTSARPESLLTNLSSDFLLEYRDSVIKKPVDIAFMNVGGIRAPIPDGDITLGHIFSSFPFDNSLTVVHIKGIYLLEIFESYARMGGGGVSGNVRLEIKEGRASNVTLNGSLIDKEKIYSVITLDYLAEGNDGMGALKNAEDIYFTGITIRDYMLQKIKELTDRGKPVVARQDERIKIIG
jgi:2',3'-cyclic-nucleotide 2'-phosphodiesterase (5'-nucleotidase family)